MMDDDVSKKDGGWLAHFSNFQMVVLTLVELIRPTAENFHVKREVSHFRASSLFRPPRTCTKRHDDTFTRRQTHNIHILQQVQEPTTQQQHL